MLIFAAHAMNLLASLQFYLKIVITKSNTQTHIVKGKNDKESKLLISYRPKEPTYLLIYIKHLI